jgi:hypothetical protein
MAAIKEAEWRSSLNKVELNEEQYKKITEACDEILLAPDANLTTIAIPWLHVLNEHPENQKKYAKLFEPGYAHSKQWGLYFLIDSIKAVAGILRSAKSKHKITGKRSVIFISHLLNESQVGNPTDFYFGDLPSALVKTQLPGLLLLLNHTELNPAGLPEKWDSSGGERAISPQNLGFFKEVSIRVSLFREAYRLFRKRHKEIESFKRDVIIKAATEAISSSSVHALRMYHYIASLVKVSGAESIAVTYEGHSWERLAFAGARSSNAGVRCIGYHHTIIFPRQHAALRNLPGLYQPDIIFTAGDYARDYFRKAYPEYVDVLTLGMHRLKKETLLQKKNFADNTHPVCLVIPDGIISEILYMFRFVIEAAGKEPDIYFLLRLHPAITKEFLLAEYAEFRALPENVIFSSHDLQSDFEQSNWALYRGSNAAIYATLAGLRPIYLMRENELGIDCLFELHTWKRMINTISALLAVLRKDIDEKNQGEWSLQSTDAIEQVKKYFMPVNDNVFIEHGLKRN